MPDDGAGLDALVSVIETLQERIRRDHATIGSNETRTRRELIDPVLGALGWVDSSVVTPEYLVRYGPGGGDYRVADYALHAPGQRAQPIAFIEAKRMREDLTDDHREQAFTYAYIRDSARYVGLTNGDRWEFYEAGEDRFLCILDVSIRDESAAHCAEELLPFKCRAEDFENGEHFGHTKGRGVTALSSRYQGGVPPAARQSYRERSGAVDTRRVLGWSVLVALCGVIVGYVHGLLGGRSRSGRTLWRSGCGSCWNPAGCGGGMGHAPPAMAHALIALALANRRRRKENVLLVVRRHRRRRRPRRNSWLRRRSTDRTVHLRYSCRHRRDRRRGRLDWRGGIDGRGVARQVSTPGRTPSEQALQGQTALTS